MKPRHSHKGGVEDAHISTAIGECCLKLLLNHATEHHKLTAAQIGRIAGWDEQAVPASIFATKELRPLEALCRYLMEERSLTYREISKAIGRDYRTVWATCRHSLGKMKEKLHPGPSEYRIPLAVFQNNSLSVLEAVVCFLKDKQNLKFSRIAGVLQRDQRNIWGIYRKATGK